ncbi:hypothetical protein EYF80_032641 [Liparis tanakae]|uniref:Uncharacterized protein n=1 Tax=Liparis tanakae TaxID=230148 RepID=A0A4Z2GU64_9TELE|nr:hypothetical protein EYF80_032641 [Liparis tanakae]
MEFPERASSRCRGVMRLNGTPLDSRVHQRGLSGRDGHCEASARWLRRVDSLPPFVEHGTEHLDVTRARPARCGTLEHFQSLGGKTFFSHHHSGAEAGGSASGARFKR